MQLGILVSTMETGSLKECIKLAKDIGYTHIEISACLNDDRPNIGSCTKEEAKEIAVYIRDMGIEISSLQCHFHMGYSLLDGETIPNVPLRSAETMNSSIEHTKRIIDLANYLDIGIVHTVSGILPELDAEQNFKYTGDIDYPSRKEWHRLLQSYETILDFASKTKVKIAIEPVFAYIVGNYATTKKLFEDINRDDLYLNYDPSHFPYHRESAISLIKDFGERIIHVHVKDAKVSKLKKEDLESKHAYAMKGGEEEFMFAPPGKGVFNWDEIILALKEAGYNGVLSAEMGHGYPGNPEQNAREGLKFFKDLLKKFELDD